MGRFGKRASSMWIVTNRGFMSIVAKDRNGKKSGPHADDEVSVRFRRPQDAEALFPDHPVVLTPHGDYACRVFATREEVAKVVCQEALEIDYTNFKSSIPRKDHALIAAAHEGWSAFGRLQNGGPYGRPWPGGAVRSSQPRLPLDDAWKGDKHDPFCAGCGMRYGAENLDENGLCAECVGGAG
jgi:hypothetical protein